MRAARADDAGKSLAYLKATSAETAPDDVLVALAEGMVQVPAYIEGLAKASNAIVPVRIHRRPSQSRARADGHD